MVVVAVVDSVPVAAETGAVGTVHIGPAGTGPARVGTVHIGPVEPSAVRIHVLRRARPLPGEIRRAQVLAVFGHW